MAIIPLWYVESYSSVNHNGTMRFDFLRFQCNEVESCIILVCFLWNFGSRVTDKNFNLDRRIREGSLLNIDMENLFGDLLLLFVFQDLCFAKSTRLFRVIKS